MWKHGFFLGKVSPVCYNTLINNTIIESIQNCNYILITAAYSTVVSTSANTAFIFFSYLETLKGTEYALNIKFALDVKYVRS